MFLFGQSKFFEYCDNNSKILFLRSYKNTYDLDLVRLGNYNLKKDDSILFYN